MSPVKIRVTRKDQVNMLVSNRTDQSSVLEVLMEGMKDRIIEQP